MMQYFYNITIVLFAVCALRKTIMKKITKLHYLQAIFHSCVFGFKGRGILNSTANA